MSAFRYRGRRRSRPGRPGASRGCPEAAVGEDDHRSPVPRARASQVGHDVVHGRDEPGVLSSRRHGLDQVTSPRDAGSPALCPGRWAAATTTASAPCEGLARNRPGTRACARCTSGARTRRAGRPRPEASLAQRVQRLAHRGRDGERSRRTRSRRAPSPLTLEAALDAAEPGQDSRAPSPGSTPASRATAMAAIAFLTLCSPGSWTRYSPRSRPAPCSAEAPAALGCGPTSSPRQSASFPSAKVSTRHARAAGSRAAARSRCRRQRGRAAGSPAAGARTRSAPPRGRGRCRRGRTRGCR
jgi:hypothetical protein